jgi:hypothetical protein
VPVDVVAGVPDVVTDVAPDNVPDDVPDVVLLEEVVDWLVSLGD